MDIGLIQNFIFEFSILLTTAAVGLVWAFFGGRQSLINLICAGYLALLLFKLQPYQSLVNENTYLAIGGFLFLTVLGFLFFRRVMPSEYLENRFESFGKKILLTIAFTIFALVLIMNYLPFSDLLGTQPALLSWLNNQTFSFWYLLIPLVIMAAN